MIKVSVVIPVYNVEMYLAECVDSVLHQTYQNLQIILVDDGSRDHSPELCDEYAQQDVRITVIHQKNGGLSDARNTGLQHADGDYIYFLDSDDFIDPNTIELLLQTALRCDADLLFFDSVVKHEGNSSDYPPDFYIRKGLYSNPLPGYQMAELLMKHGEFFTSVPMLFIRRNLLCDHALTFMKGILHEDELFTFEVFLNSACAVHVAVPFYHRRVRECSIMTVKASAANYFGLRHIFDKLTTMYDNETDAERKKLLRLEQMHIFEVLFVKYTCIKGTDRAKVHQDFLKLKNEIAILQYFDSASIRRKCQYPYIYTFISKPKVRATVEKALLLRNRYRVRKRNKTLFFTLKKRVSGEKRIFLIGVPTHGNLGDHAIAEAECRFFKERFPAFTLYEIPTPVYNSMPSRIAACCQKQDLVVISGGGWLGDLWLHNENTVRDIIKRIKQSPIVIMPQTVYFSDTENGRREEALSKTIFAAHPHLTLFLRDQKSFEYTKAHKYVRDCLYAPDMALYGFLDTIPVGERTGCLLCFRKDREKDIDSGAVIRLAHMLSDQYGSVRYTTTVYNEGFPPEHRIAALRKKLEEYASASLVVTDRLHSMIFAALTGTPCIAVDNLTSKVSGVYSWICTLPYVKIVDSIDRVLSTAEQMDLTQIYCFPKTLLCDEYQHIEQCIANRIETVHGNEENH